MAKKISIFVILFISIISLNLFNVKAVPTSSIPTGYIPYRSEYTSLYFGENLDNEVYFDTSILISVPSLSKNVYTTLSTGGWFTYNNVRYNSLYLIRRENGETGEELATVRFYNTASDDLSSDILTYDYSLGTYKFSWSTQIKNASPTIIVEDNVRIYNASPTAEGTSILNDVLFNSMYVKYIPDESTTYNVRLDELSQEGFVSILTNESEADKIKYSINDSSILYTLSNDFPLTLEYINTITIYNNSTLDLGILADFDDSFRTLAPGLSYEYTITENTILYFGFAESSSTNYDITLAANLNYLNPSNYPNERIYYYTNDDDSASNLLTTLDLPYTLQANSIKFVNNSSNYKLHVSFDNMSNVYILNSGESTDWITIENNTVIELGLSDNISNISVGGWYYFNDEIDLLSETGILHFETTFLYQNNIYNRFFYRIISSSDSTSYVHATLYFGMYSAATNSYNYDVAVADFIYYWSDMTLISFDWYDDSYRQIFFGRDQFISASNYEWLSNNGIFAYIDNPSETGSTEFADIFYALVDSQIHFIQSLLGWELFGLNLFNAFTSILTLTFVIFFLRRLL